MEGPTLGLKEKQAIVVRKVLSSLLNERFKAA